MLPVLFTATAQTSLADVFGYLTGPLANPQAAKTPADKIARTPPLLGGHPELSPLCAEPRLHRMQCRKALLGKASPLLCTVEKTRGTVLLFCHSRQAYWHLL